VRRDHDVATAFAPASIGNVAVGFDILGQSVPTLGDRVTARAIPEREARIAAIRGVANDLPVDAGRNTASVAVNALIETVGLDHGFALTIEKGIPVGSGLGSSAASAVAAVVAANALLPVPLDKPGQLMCAIAGEQIASGSRHADNVAPSLYGGLVLTVGIDNPIVKRIPVPDGICCVVVRPEFELTTRKARQVLKRDVALSDVVWQQANLAGFLTGCFTGDLKLIGESLQDIVIEPQRRSLIPGFASVKAAALGGGALGCSISGAGPSVFAWCEEAQAPDISREMVAAFQMSGLSAESWISSIGCPGAQVSVI
jgi:homoserine kinase